MNAEADMQHLVRADLALARTAAEDLEAGGFTARASAISACVRSAEMTGLLLSCCRDYLAWADRASDRECIASIGERMRDIVGAAEKQR